MKQPKRTREPTRVTLTIEELGRLLDGRYRDGHQDGYREGLKDGSRQPPTLVYPTPQPPPVSAPSWWERWVSRTDGTGPR